MNRRPGPLNRLFRWAWHFKLTRGGRFLVGSIVGATLCASPSSQSPSYAPMLCLFCVGLLAFLLNCALRPLGLRKGSRLRVSFPDRGMADEIIRGTATIESSALRRPIHVLSMSAGFLGLPTSVRHAGGDVGAEIHNGGGHATIPLALKALKRGVYSLPPVRAFWTWPLNLFRSGKLSVSVPPLMIIPRFTPIENIDLPVGRRYQPGGFALTSNLGDSPEYVGNRYYVPGDSVRRIDSRAWARLGRPAVREYQEEYYCRIALVLDTYIPRRRRTRPEGFEELEAAISLAAAIADALSRGEYIIDIFAAGPELYTFRAGQNMAHLDNVLEILSCVEACRKNPFDTLAPALAEEVANIATMICVFLDWDESRRHLVQMAEETGCLSRVVIVRRGKTTESLDTAGSTRVTVVDPASVCAGGVTQL
jgi:uncharacterized protein (DUF58 family)